MEGIKGQYVGRRCQTILPWRNQHQKRSGYHSRREADRPRAPSKYEVRENNEDTTGNCRKEDEHHLRICTTSRLLRR